MSFSREHPQTSPNHRTSTLTNIRKRDNAALVDATTSTLNNSSKKRKVDHSQKDNQTSTIRHDHSGASTSTTQSPFGDMIEHRTLISATRAVQVYEIRYYPRDSAHLRPQRPLPSSIAPKPRAGDPARYHSHSSASSTASSSSPALSPTASSSSSAFSPTTAPRALVSRSSSSSLPKTSNHRATTAKQTAKPSKSANQPRDRRRPHPSQAKGPRAAKRAHLPAVVTPGSSATSSTATSPTTPPEKPKEGEKEMSVEEYNELWQRITPGSRPPLTRAQVWALPKIAKKKKSESVAA
ncbi:hypothetical protein C8Q74DRAFT_1374412 [Fomes fomentarius]|nr:hypothetical protein C8Q74DRAFT_1374412 [Fomes fomentarius]